MTIQILGGSTSQTVRLFIQDTSKTDGSGLTGLVHNTSGLTAYYSKGATGTATAITLATQTAGGAWTSGGFVAVDGTNMPGVYRLDVPNAALDSEVETIVMLRGAANMAPVLLRVMGGKTQANAVTVADKTGYSLSAGGVTGVTDGVWNALDANYTLAGSFGAKLIRSTNSNNQVSLTGGPNPHIAASIHNAEPNSIPAGALTTAALGEIQNGLGTLENQNTILARIGSFTGTGINTVLGFLRAMMNKAASTPSDVGGTYSTATDSLEAIRDRGDVAWITGATGAGSGAYTITVTVNDGTNALQNATVRVTEGVNSYTATTNSSGVCTFNLDAASYSVAITKSGYSFSGTTLVVNATDSVTYSMTQISVTPGTGNLTTGYFTALDGSGVAESGALFYVEMTKVPSSSTGFAFDSQVREVTSNGSGLVSVTGLIKGATYRIWRGKRTDYQVLIPANAGATYELPSILGREQ